MIHSKTRGMSQRERWRRRIWVGLLLLAVGLAVVLFLKQPPSTHPIEAIEGTEGWPRSGEEDALVSRPLLPSGHRDRVSPGGLLRDASPVLVPPQSDNEGLAVQVCLQPLQGKPQSLRGARVWVYPQETWGREESEPLQESSPTDGQGWTVFGELPAGRYVLQLDPNSLPTGYRPPGNIETGRVLYPGVSLVRVDWLAQGRQETRLVAQPELRLAGRVVCARGSVPQGTQVLVQPRGGGPMRAMQWLSVDANGSFVTDEVFPLPYSVNVVLPRGLQDPCARVAPPPQFVSLQSGSVLDLELRLGGGRAVATGRVLDTAGKPMGNVPVLAYYHDADVRDFHYSWLQAVAEVRTDALGRYRLEDLEEYPFRVVVDPEGARRGPMGGRRLMRVPEAIDVPRARLTANMDLGTLEVERARLFEVSGVVRVQAGEIASSPVKLRHLELSARWFPEELATEAPYVDLDLRTGRFVVTCEAPGERLVLSLTSRRGPGVPRSWTFYPVVGGQEEGVELFYPASRGH